MPFWKDNFPTDNPNNPIDWDWFTFTTGGVGVSQTIVFPSIAYIKSIQLQPRSIGTTSGLIKIYWDGVNPNNNRDFYPVGADATEGIAIFAGNLSVIHKFDVCKRVYSLTVYQGEGGTAAQVIICYSLLTKKK